MIPDFKTYIKESVWADLHSRGIGETEREEDEVNLLDRDALYDYLCTHYEIIDKNCVPYQEIVNIPSNDIIIVPGFKTLHSSLMEPILYNFKNNIILINYSFPFQIDGLFDKLTDNFKLKNGTTYKYIYPKDGSEVTNRFFIEFLDFIIENIPKKLCLLKKSEI